MTAVRVELPPKLLSVFAPKRGELRFRGAYGGRGSAKSYTFAMMAAMWGFAEKLRVLCTRELQVSIKESFHAEIKQAILNTPWLADHYDVGVDYIKGRNGTEFIFRGLRTNMTAIKSMAGIDLCIVEEAEDVPDSSFVDLEPTIRAPKSEIWLLWNPKIEGSAVDKYRTSPPPRSAIVEMNYRDNPWFPLVLEELRQHQQLTREPAMYAHIWEGAYLKNSLAQVFANKWRYGDFTPAKDWDGPYYGLDFGFSQDPTAAVECWVYNRNLYIYKSGGRVGLELDHTAEYFDQCMPEMKKHVIRADCSRPESISYLKRNGMPRIIGCKKGAGSVEDGIEHMKSYTEIIVHQDCKDVGDEFLKYSYKVLKSGDITNDVVDMYNHGIDAIRYAIEPLMRPKSKGFFS